MLKSLVITVALLAGTISAHAALATDIYPNGTASRCVEASDAGTRAFRLHPKEVAPNSLVLQVETLVCLRLEDKMTLIPYALAAKQTFKNNGHIITYENIEASLVITNTEATSLLARINLDLSKFQQDIMINPEELRANTFDISLQMYEVIRIDGKLVDQGVRVNGSYRVVLN